MEPKHIRKILPEVMKKIKKRMDDNRKRNERQGAEK